MKCRWGVGEGHRLLWKSTVRSIPDLVVLLAVAECAMKSVKEIVCVRLDDSLPLSPCVLWIRHTLHFCRPSSQSWSHQVAFPCPVSRSWVWIAELAAILYEVTIKLFSTLFSGEAGGGGGGDKEEIESAYTLLKILELSCDRIQQIVIKYKPEPELPLSSVSSSTKLSGIWDPL